MEPELSDSVVVLTGNSIPSIDGLWKVNEGQAQIHSAERLLLNPEITAAERQMALDQMERAWVQIDEGLQQAENTPDNNEEEEALFADFKQKWAGWKQTHETFVALEAEFNQIGFRNPWAAQLALMEQGEIDPLELARVQRAKELYAQLETFSLTEESPEYEAVSALAKSILTNNVVYTNKVSDNTDQIVSATKRLSTMTMVLGPLKSMNSTACMSANLKNYATRLPSATKRWPALPSLFSPGAIKM